jgi:endonuclease YncB( thermonuclease family)
VLRRLTILCALLLAGVPVTSADAARGPCRPDGSGPTCQVWTGHATSVNDGDTIDVDIDGDHKKRSYHIRFIGIQAMELTVHANDPRKRRDECHGIEATSFVEKMLRQAHGRVRLTAQHPTTDHLGRLFRSVNVRIGGHWVDLGEREMAAGLTLWMHHEPSIDRLYNELEQRAAQRGIGMFNTTKCGVGPSQNVPLKVWVMSDPFGGDGDNWNNEWVKIQNQSATSRISLAHWWMRDSMLRRYTFPAGTAIDPGQTITLHVGRGSRTAKDFYWGINASVWENSIAGGGVGDGAYLFDPKGDLRAWMIYPCLVNCVDPNQGAVRLTASPGGHEYVLVTNISTHDVDLYGYELRFPGGYAFPHGTVLAPGQSVQVSISGSPSTDSARVVHVGHSGPYMADSGGSVELTTFSEIRLACDAWGRGHC